MLITCFPFTEVGKCRAGVGAIVGFGHEAIHVKKFEALLGDQRAVRWVPYSGRLNIRDLGGRPVEGGREDDGTVLVIARAHAQHSSGLFGLGGGGQSGTFPGKASEKLKGAYVTVGDKEVEVDVSVFYRLIDTLILSISFSSSIGSYKLYVLLLTSTLSAQDYEVLCFA